MGKEIKTLIFSFLMIGQKVICTIKIDMALYGNMDELLKYKPFLKREINDGEFGSPPLTRLLTILKPSYWFSAHMHIKYAALFPHKDNYYTHFLALDKCLQKRSCLQIIKLKENEKEEEIKE